MTSPGKSEENLIVYCCTSSISVLSCYVAVYRQDYNFRGHQLVCHYVGADYRCPDFYNAVDGDEVPVPHFGLAVGEEEICGN